MRIEEVDISWYRAEHPQPMANGRFVLVGTSRLVFQVRTDAGPVGVGWTNGNHLLMPIAEDMARRVLGADPFHVERIAAGLEDVIAYGRAGRAARVRSGIDIACWDIMGKVSGRPLYELLGGYRDRVPAYVAAGYYLPGQSPQALAEDLLAEVAAGAHAVKMKVGRASIAEDLARVRAVREAVGDGIALIVDANGSYDRVSSRRMARGLAELDVYWFEEPLDFTDLGGHAELRSQVDVPLAIGEGENSWLGLAAVLRAGAADILNPDAQNLGGVTAWRRVTALAQAAHIRFAPHGDQELHAHLVAAAPNGLMVEFYRGANSLREAMFTEPLRLNDDGTVSPPRGPGIGVQLDEDGLRSFRQAHVVVR